MLAICFSFSSICFSYSLSLSFITNQAFCTHCAKSFLICWLFNANEYTYIFDWVRRFNGYWRSISIILLFSIIKFGWTCCDIFPPCKHIKTPNEFDSSFVLMWNHWAWDFFHQNVEENSNKWFVKWQKIHRICWWLNFLANTDYQHKSVWLSTGSVVQYSLRID